MRLAVLTTGRQDWGILSSTCALLRDSREHELILIAGGMACSERHGRVDEAIAADGFSLAERLPWGAGEHSVHAETGEAVRMVGDALERQRPSALILVGDRFETMAAAVAATTSKVPLVHLHGGEETQGAFDDAFRHAVTKLSHLHLVSHEDHRRRIVEMGEAPGSVHVVGAPGLDNLHRNDLATRAELAEHLGIALDAPLVIVTVHPATLSNDLLAEVACVVGAMDATNATYVITLPNADPGNEPIRKALLEATRGHPRRVAVDSLGERRFWGLMRIADAMLGNSSSALIEAPAVGLPAVNVGDRQRGRVRGANVIDVPATDVTATIAALPRALDPAFRRAAAAAVSPFGDGHSAPRIVEILSRWRPVLGKKHYRSSP